MAPFVCILALFQVLVAANAGEALKETVGSVGTDTGALFQNLEKGKNRYESLCINGAWVQKSRHCITTSTPSLRELFSAYLDVMPSAEALAMLEIDLDQTVDCGEAYLDLDGLRCSSDDALYVCSKNMYLRIYVNDGRIRSFARRTPIVADAELSSDEAAGVMTAFFETQRNIFNAPLEIYSGKNFEGIPYYSTTVYYAHTENRPLFTIRDSTLWRCDNGLPIVELRDGELPDSAPAVLIGSEVAEKTAKSFLQKRGYHRPTSEESYLTWKRRNDYFAAEETAEIEESYCDWRYVWSVRFVPKFAFGVDHFGAFLEWACDKECWFGKWQICSVFVDAETGEVLGGDDL